MTQIEAVKAYKALLNLSECKMPIAAALAVFRAKKALSPAFEFHAEQERKIAESHHAKVENGSYKINDPEEAQKMVAELKELCEADSGITVDRITIKADDGIRLSPADIEALEPILMVE